MHKHNKYFGGKRVLVVLIILLLSNTGCTGPNWLNGQACGQEIHNMVNTQYNNPMRVTPANGPGNDCREWARCWLGCVSLNGYCACAASACWVLGACLAYVNAITITCMTDCGGDIVANIAAGNSVHPLVASGIARLSTTVPAGII